MGKNIISGFLLVALAAAGVAFAGCDREQSQQEDPAPKVAAADVLGYYQDILTFPRAGAAYPNEIDAYLLEQADILGVEGEKDKAGNVLLRARATEGMEGVRPLVLLAYTGAVIAQDPAKAFDPQTDGVSLVHSEEHVHADGLSMGANGAIGAATMLAVLDAAERHGEIVCVFAAGDGSVLSAEVVPDAALASAAEASADMPLPPFDLPEGAALIEIGDGDINRITDTFPAATILSAETTVSAVRTGSIGRAYVIAAAGFPGGPAEVGAETKEAYANPVSVISRILSEAKNAGCVYSLCSFSGGADACLRPEEAQATVVLGDYEERQFRKVFDAIAEETMEALGGEDGGAEIRMIETTRPPEAIDAEDVSSTLTYLYGITGLDVKGVDDAPLSLNVGRLRFDTEAFQCGIAILGAPSAQAAIADVVSDLRAFERMSGIYAVRAGEIPGYDPVPEEAVDAAFPDALSASVKTVTGDDAASGDLSAMLSPLGNLAQYASVARIGIPVHEEGTPKEYFDKADAAIPANVILDYIDACEPVA
jgi:dipeptidase D